MQFDFAPIANAPPAIRLHLATVVPAAILGAWLIFVSRKGARLHRALGVLYLVLMTVTAVTTLFIYQLHPGHLSWIHLLVPLTLYGVFRTIWSLRRGDIAGHRNAMIALYAGAILIAGGFTFVPGRLLHKVFFG